METDTKRRESASRLRSKKLQLQRFHDQICLRITERQQQSRLEAQRQEKLLDAKFAAVFEATKPKESGRQHARSPARRPCSLQPPEQFKSSQLQGSALAAQIDKVLRIDVQTRELMLASVIDPLEKAQEPASSRSGNPGGEWGLLDCDDADSDSDTSSTNAATTLLPTQQRVALYAAARRRKKRNALLPPSSSTRSAGNQTRERFLSALASELRTPALCSCARNMAASPFYARPCANNCALYNDPKKRERLFTSVYKHQQHQQ
ncbi:hypothetical protein PybrP1_005767 [[Pythium] brassicae (nom. inval.)]|nr:hypothetical protein PybrP1_005767 [[Pythium] brassicae (nom. inval.)]